MGRFTKKRDTACEPQAQLRRPRVSAIFKEPPAGQQMEYGGSEGLEWL